MEQNKLDYQYQCLSVLIEQEYKRSKVLHQDKFTDMHHAHSVLREEIQEASEECKKIIDEVEINLWRYARENKTSTAIESVELIRETALKLIEESIQICAMCDKWTMSLGGKEDGEI